MKAFRSQGQLPNERISLDSKERCNRLQSFLRITADFILRIRKETGVVVAYMHTPWVKFLYEMLVKISLCAIATKRNYLFACLSQHLF